MRQHRLPRTDVGLTAVGFGAAQAGNLQSRLSDEEFDGAVDAAWTLGIRYFDTAPHYGLGLSERRLGAALRGRPRADYVLSTKVGRLLVPSPETADRSDLPVGGFDVPATTRREWDFSRDGVLRSLEASLGRLGLDRVDIVYLHDPDDFGEQALKEAIPALVELRDQGVVSAIGAGMNQSAMLSRFVREADIDVVMCAGRYTLLNQTAGQDLLPAAVQRGVGVVLAGVFNSGLLATDPPVPGASYDYAPASAALYERAVRIAAVCAEYDVPLPQAALAFAAGHPAVVSTVVGMRDRDQVQQAVDRSAAPVPDDLWPALVRAGLLPDDAVPISRS